MPLNVAIVGCGKVARSNYLPFLSKQPDVALHYLSRTRASAEACAQSFGGTVHETPAALLAAAPDSILILTHETQRLAATQALLDAGTPRRLFFEKPLVAADGQANVTEADFADAKALLSRAEAAGSETAMVFNYRFFEVTQRARAILSERDFGALTQAALLVNYACWSHCIDLLHVFGGPAAQIAALSSAAQFVGAVDVAAGFTLVGGATGTILGSSGFPFAHSLYDVHLNFERGSLRFRDLDGALEVLGVGDRYKQTHALTDNHSRWDQYRDSFDKAMAAYLDTVRRGVPPPIPGRAGLEELQFEAALRRSIAEGRPVPVQVEFPIT